MAVRDKIIKKKHWTQEEFEVLMAGVPISTNKCLETLAKVQRGLQQIKEGKGIPVKHSELDKFLDS